MNMRDLKSLVYLERKLRAEGVEEEEKKELRRRIARITRWIDKIEDPMIHDVFEYRFVRGFTWAKVSHRIGGGNTEDGVRMMVKRYLEKQ